MREGIPRSLVTIRQHPQQFNIVAPPVAAFFLRIASPQNIKILRAKPLIQLLTGQHSHSADPRKARLIVLSFPTIPKPSMGAKHRVIPQTTERAARSPLAALP